MARGAEGARGLRSKFGRCLFGKRYGNEEHLMARLVCNLAWFFLACGFAFGQASPGSVDHEWRSYGHDPGGMRFSRLNQINRANVQKLQRVWTYHTGETNWSSFSGPQHIQAFETTPLMVDGVVYLTTPASRAIALDAETGKEIWIFDPFSGASGKRGTLQNRGVAYWEGNSPVACESSALAGGALKGIEYPYLLPRFCVQRDGPAGGCREIDHSIHHQRSGFKCLDMLGTAE